MKNNSFLRLIVSLGGIAFIQPFPTLWASLITTAVLFFIWPFFDMALKLGVIFFVFILGWILGNAVEYYEHMDDPHFFVLDEVVGLLIATLFLPQNFLPWIASFILFGFFDLVKIWPGSVFDRQKGGFAMMMDDVIAGMYAMAIMAIGTFVLF